ncbi:hypothetical protein Tco_0777604 [Tanacetum coccineum]
MPKDAGMVKRLGTWHARCFQENIKKAKRQDGYGDHVNDVSTISTALYQPAETRYNEIDAVKKGKVYVEKREKLLMSFVNSRDNDWKTFIRSLNTHNVNKSGEDHNHDAKMDNLSKCLFGWNVKTGKRGPLGSSVADVKFNNVSNAKYYSGLGRHDLGEVDEDVKEAAKILVPMAHDHQLKAKQSTMAQTKVEAANCLMCLDDIW